jgi:hypothetical protein
MLSVVIMLAIVGLVIYLITTYIPMPQIMKTIILVIVALCVILWLMNIFGLGDIPIPHIPRR